jgi:hypothetical protein
MSSMARCASVACASTIVLSGCWSTYHGQKPITPVVDATVDTLRPTLLWEPSEEEGVSYDVRLQESLTSEAYRDPNEVPFYREAVPAPSCTVDPPLKPGHTYIWAVRVRKGTEVTAWSSYDRSYYALLFWGTTHGIRYSFTTSPTATEPKTQATPSVAGVPPRPTPGS